jgi:hypothetical protein
LSSWAPITGFGLEKLLDNRNAIYPEDEECTTMLRYVAAAVPFMLRFYLRANFCGATSLRHCVKERNSPNCIEKENERRCWGRF